MQQETALDAVTSMLPSLEVPLRTLSLQERYAVEEIRMRRGYPVSVLLSNGEHSLCGETVEERDLRTILEHASQASVHTILEQIKNGFVTLKGGHRIGLCGTVTCMDGKVHTVRHLSSVNIRIARAVQGQAGEILSGITENGLFVSTLILGAPGSGKTTLLRELIRVLSEGIGALPQRVALADERSEVAALWQGEPQFYVGRQTDVLDGCRKGEAMSFLLRGMNPQVLAADEITHPEDIQAMLEAVGCGVSLLATAHGNEVGDLTRRPVYRHLLAEGAFQRVVVIRRNGSERTIHVERLS